MMTRAEKIEVLLIGLTVPGAWLLSRGLFWRPAIGTLIGYAAALLLAQGLIRDLGRLLTRRVASGQRQRIRCACAESTIGVGLLALAVLLTLAGLTEPVTVGRGAFTTGVSAVLILGFVAKDFVIIIRREKDHGRIIPW